MTEKLFIKPVVKDAVITDPKTGERLPAEGAEVEATDFWLRRILHGCVVKAAPAAKAARADATIKSAE